MSQAPAPKTQTERFGASTVQTFLALRKDVQPAVLEASKVISWHRRPNNAAASQGAAAMGAEPAAARTDMAPGIAAARSALRAWCRQT
mmetsp:Transcript_78681/g.218518  ORF Transcript_78681/g.218518 Transcript_78681/m.218518 type:complete len:88 (+) Transcript_78681:1748-2011(+)